MKAKFVKREIKSQSLVSVLDDEPRVDSRIIAKQLDVEHESVMRLVDKNFNEFSELDAVRFEIGVPKEPTGNPPRFIFLSEDQCYFLLTLVRNSSVSVPLKKQLVLEFSTLRKGFNSRPVRNVFVRPTFPTLFNPDLGFETVAPSEDMYCKRTRVGFDWTIKEFCGLTNPTYIRTLTNLVFRIFTGFEVKDFRRGWGIPAGSRIRTRLFVDSNLRRAIDEVEAEVQTIIQQHQFTEFPDIYETVDFVTKSIALHCKGHRIELIRHIPVEMRLIS